jgi:hypothetical protein
MPAPTEIEQLQMNGNPIIFDIGRVGYHATWRIMGVLAGGILMEPVVGGGANHFVTWRRMALYSSNWREEP